MPVAQLVNLFESLDITSTDSRQSRMRRTSRASSPGKRLSLRTMFRSHARVSSSSSTATTVSSSGSAPSPTLSSHSFEFLPSGSTFTSPSTERGHDPFTAFSPIEFPQPKEKSMRPVRLQRAFSSTSLALQSQYQVDRFESAGLDLFEPRPHDIFSSSQTSIEPVVLDGILEVMEGA